MIQILINQLKICSMALQERFKPLGLDPENYLFEYYPYKIDTGDPGHKPVLGKAKQVYFKETDKGDIEIYYPSLNPGGLEIHYTDKGYKKYTRIRYKDPGAHSNIKYVSPGGSGIRIFLPYNTLQKIRNKETIDTLYIIEGEFKSVYGDFYGLDIIGIAGIHLFIDKAGSRDLHKTIQQILQDCRVSKVCLMFDSDLREIKFEFEQDPGKDYAERLNSFCSAILKFKLAVYNYNQDLQDKIKRKPEEARDPIKPLFTHIREGYTTKGLDDLLEARSDQIPQILQDLSEGSKAKEYFHTINLEDTTKPELQRYFYLDLDKQGFPTTFYNKFYQEIQDRKFVFFSSVYRYNEDRSILEILYHKELDKYVRVGIDYYKEIEVPFVALDKFKKEYYTTHKILKKWSSQAIKQDFVYAKGITKTFNYIQAYDDFTNVPEHRNFKKIIENCYNLYYPLKHKPIEGSWSNIEYFLKHLFQNEYQDKYTLILDLLYLKYIIPVQKLPITVLFSREKNTGKSTFLWLLNEMYGDNASILSNKDLEDNFNEFVVANVILIDEAIIEKDRIIDMLKSWSTLPQISMNRKQKDRQKVPFFATMFLTSNRINFAQIDEDENRFLICKIPELQTIDESLLQKMIEEIPAFIFYLENTHILKYPYSQTRFWFPFKDLETDILREVKENTRKASYKAIYQYAKQMFFDFQIYSFKATSVIVAPELRKYAHREISTSEVINTLKDDFKILPGKNGRFHYPRWTHSGGSTEDPVWDWFSYYEDNKSVKRYYSGAPYEFEAVKILTKEDLEDLEKSILEDRSSNLTFIQGIKPTEPEPEPEMYQTKMFSKQPPY
jgi:hypothetical protein